MNAQLGARKTEQGILTQTTGMVTADVGFLLVRRVFSAKVLIELVDYVHFSGRELGDILQLFFSLDICRSESPRHLIGGIQL